MMDSNTIAPVVSGAFAFLAAVVAGLTTIRSGRDRKDREADRTVAKTTAEKIAAERDHIAEQTRGMLLNDVRDELARVKSELASCEASLEQARRHADELREALAEKNHLIHEQDRKIRRLTKRGALLENWVENNKKRFTELGIAPVPHYDDDGGPY